MLQTYLSFSVDEIQNESISLKISFYLKSGDNLSLIERLNEGLKMDRKESSIVKILEKEFPENKLMTSVIKSLLENWSYRITDITKISWSFHDHHYFEITAEKVSRMATSVG